MNIICDTEKHRFRVRVAPPSPPLPPPLFPSSLLPSRTASPDFLCSQSKRGEDEKEKTSMEETVPVATEEAQDSSSGRGERASKGGGRRGRTLLRGSWLLVVPPPTLAFICRVVCDQTRETRVERTNSLDRQLGIRRKQG